MNEIVDVWRSLRSRRLCCACARAARCSGTALAVALGVRLAQARHAYTYACDASQLLCVHAQLLTARRSSLQIKALNAICAVVTCSARGAAIAANPPVYAPLGAHGARLGPPPGKRARAADNVARLAGPHANSPLVLLLDWQRARACCRASHRCSPRLTKVRWRRRSSLSER